MELWLLLFVAAISLLFLLLSSGRRRPRNLPPGPTPLPVIGSLLAMGPLPHQSLARLAKIHGEVMTVQLGSVTSVVLSSPAAAKEALQTKDAEFSDRWVPDVADFRGSRRHSILWNSSTEPLWKRQRAMTISHINSNRSLENTLALRRRAVSELLMHLRRRAGRVVEVRRPVFSTLLNIVSNVLFSFDMADLTSDEPSQFEWIVRQLSEGAAMPNVSDFFPFLSFLDLQGHRRRSIFLAKKLYDTFNKIADRRKEMTKMADAVDFLEHLLRLQADSTIGRQTVEVFLADLFIAATDTSTVTIEWVMAELLRNPGVMEQARAEIEKAAGARPVEESDLEKLPYLHAVIKEVMRLHPVGPLLLPHKVAVPGAELGGYAVPEGTRVLVNTWAIGRDPEVWDEPTEFRPERFLIKDVDIRGRNFDFLPFGSGRRSCPGMPLAMRVVPLIVASMLQSFRWRLPEGVEPGDVDLSEKLGVVLALAVPLKAVPVIAGDE